ncbi:MAG: hypothetical protein KA987_08385 [Saprospiraceae bacterium]|nr:hypothetical protein [Saprospiraceae bacterium]
MEDSIANNSFKGYHHVAFLFQINGKYTTASKVNKLSSHFFNQQDFDENFPNNYLINDENLIITHYTGQEWEFSEMFKKINENLYINEKQKLTFTNWQYQDC